MKFFSSLHLPCPTTLNFNDLGKALTNIVLYMSTENDYEYTFNLEKSLLLFRLPSRPHQLCPRGCQTMSLHWASSLLSFYSLSHGVSPFSFYHTVREVSSCVASIFCTVLHKNNLSLAHTGLPPIALTLCCWAKDILASRSEDEERQG